MGDEFGAVVHPDRPRAPAMVKACEVEQLDHGVCIDLLVDRESEVFASVFILMLQILNIVPCQVESN